MFQFNWSSHKALLAIAIPMILSNITVPLLGLVDTAVVGHLSDAYYLGGVAVGSMIITFIFSLTVFLRMATTGVTAQAFGRGSAALQFKCLLQGLLIALVLSLVVIVLQSPIQQLGFMLAGGTEQVQMYGKLYFSIRIYSAPAAMINLVLLGWMLGMQSARGPVWHLIITNSLNIGLDLLFVFGFGWGVEGVAAATVIADYCGVAVGLYFVVLIARQNGIRFERKDLPTWAQRHELKPFILINRDIFLRSFCLAICFAFITFEGAKLGDNVVAANAILQNLLMLVSFALDGVAYAVEALVGKAVGQRDRQGLVQSIQQATFWSVIFGLSFTGLFAVAGENIIWLMSDIPEVVKTALIYLPWIVAMPLVSLWCFLLDGIFIGLTRAADMRNSMFISTFFGFFMLWWFTQGWGNHSLWLAMSGFMLLRGITLAIRLRGLLRSGELDLL
ncbi:MAG: MATE family multidrug resistance protein [Phenylobacterium sp.]